MKSRAIFTLITCLYVPVSWAQCAPGVAGCPPPDAPGWGAGATPAGDASTQPRAVWADRWGAIVLDTQTGKGQRSVTGYGSRSTAIDAAMKECTSRGAPNCELQLAYHNQCAAVAWGTGRHATAGTPSESLAKSDAIKGCGVSTCKIVYSACSLPQRVREFVFTSQSSIRGRQPYLKLLLYHLSSI